MKKYSPKKPNDQKWVDSRCIRWGNAEINPTSSTNYTKIHQQFSHTPRPPTDDSWCCHWNGYKNLGTKFKVHFKLRIKMIPHLLFNPILTFGIKMQIIADTHKLSKYKLNSLRSPEYHGAPKAKKCFSMTVKVSRHKHVLFLGH